MDMKDLVVDNANLFRTLVASYGSPLYVYNLDTIRSRLFELRRVVTSKAKLFYSAKANPLLANELSAEGLGVEVTSTAELNAVNPDARGRVLYGGPAQTPQEMRYALDHGVRQFSVESVSQLILLDQQAEQLGLKPKVIIRVNPHIRTNARLSMTGVASQFGMDIEHIQSNKTTIKALMNLRLMGVHTYLGTQIEPLQNIVDACEISLAVLDEVSQALDCPLSVINFGGGFPWPYAQRGEVCLGSIEKGINELVLRASDRGIECWFESGRFLAASSGTLIFRVLEKKTSKGRDFILADAGVHCLGGMSGLGRTLRQKVDIVPLQCAQVQDQMVHLATVVGPLCTPLDIVARDVSLGPVQEGELLTIENVGAYGLTASLVAFLGKPVPMEVVIVKGKVKCALALKLVWEQCADARA